MGGTVQEGCMGQVHAQDMGLQMSMGQGQKIVWRCTHQSLHGGW